MFCDSHNDFLLYKNNQSSIEAYLKNEVEKAGVRCVLSAVYTTDFASEATMTEVADRFKAARAVSERFVCTVEDCFFVTPNNLDKLIELKPFCCTLTWNNQNALAGGANSGAGFSKWGKEVVKELERHNIIIDCAHLNRKSFFELADLTSLPMFNSHTCLCSTYDHPRNITDEQVQVILESGGYIGLTLVNSFYKKSGLVDCCDIAAQIDRFVQKFGDICVGIGTDFYGIKEYPIDFYNYTQLGNLKQKLLERGLAEEQIGRIFVQNLLSLLPIK